MILIVSSILLVLFVIGCSKAQDQSDAEQEEITGSAVEEAENCRFADPKDCSPIEIVRGEEEQSNPELAAESNETEEKTENTTMQNLVKLSLTCKPGWECVEGKYIAYHEANCSWHSLERCIYGCSENESICTGAPICKVNSLKCEKDNLMICGEKGYEWVLNKSCDKDCENSICTEDLPANVTINITINVTTNISNNATQNNNTTNTTTQNPPQNDYIQDNCIGIINFNYDAAGSDNSSNLNDEYFTIKNSCTYSIDMTSWTANDNASNPHVYTFPSFSLSSNAEVSIRTGFGTDDSANLYWSSGSHIWNNEGDILYLKNSEGTLVKNYIYP